jgi:hypothetical protein
VIPSTLVGLVVFAASIGPGYVWLRVAEQRHARPQRSQLIEAAELVFVGGFASAVSVLIVLVIAEATGCVDTLALAEDGGAYLLQSPARGIAAFLVALVIAYIGAYVAAQLGFWREPPTLEQGYSAWHKLLAPGGPLPANRLTVDRLPYATVGLRNGTALAGYVFAYTVEPNSPQDRELALAAPLKLRGPNEAAFRDVEDQVVIVYGSDLELLSVKYYAIPPVHVGGLVARLVRWWKGRRQESAATAG